MCWSLQSHGLTNHREDRWSDGRCPRQAGRNHAKNAQGTHSRSAICRSEGSGKVRGASMFRYSMLILSDQAYHGHTLQVLIACKYLHLCHVWGSSGRPGIPFYQNSHASAIRDCKVRCRERHGPPIAQLWTPSLRVNTWIQGQPRPSVHQGVDFQKHR